MATATRSRSRRSTNTKVKLAEQALKLLASGRFEVDSNYNIYADMGKICLPMNDTKSHKFKDLLEEHDITVKGDLLGLLYLAGAYLRNDITFTRAELVNGRENSDGDNSLYDIGDDEYTMIADAELREEDGGWANWQLESILLAGDPSREGGGNYLTSEIEDSIVGWSGGFSKDADRIKAILHNIVKNDGSFVWF